MHRMASRVGQRAVLDVVVTVLGCLGVGILLVQFGGASPFGSAAAVISGLTLVSVGVVSVARRRPLFSTPADRVTLTRAVLGGGCATIVVLALLGAVPFRSWWLLLLAAPAVLLDAVDGWVARRTGTASAPGSRLDMETDAALLLVLSVPLTCVLGPWVLAVGLMRYAFVALSWWRPALRGPLGFSRFRRIVAAVQGVVLVVALVPVLPVPVAGVLVAVALALLTVSFARDVVALERVARRPRPSIPPR
ncbi:hypothetical protein GCM10011512_12440 [Tersicoccus solisilvae]|uniref:CDP-alcohol phosphatidyltransferase n=1 Tax=Tersicoccus solisilvae TaxID=1882339 RepID=A0ABQ1P173_9MICC|nr:CDP-alcohol phosphatidyltransferase family protein [Tersicoccus solisilvae]GGC87032.1 hypothetical protein GCM10011512_12440 [Tersicoccus solisilvae]